MLLIGLLTVVIAAALAAPLPVPSLRAQEDLRLASLEIGIWPEYDRPEALVILRGELAPGAQLPATVSLRIPASSGGPSAVASTATEGGMLTTRRYELTDEEDHLLLTVATPEPFFQVEFYDSLPTATSDRAYTYVWPGDLATDQLSVRVQEPAGSTNLTVEPDLGPGSIQPDGLVYHEAQMGAFEVGESLTITVRYQKTDLRTSVEVLDGTQGPDSDNGLPSWLLPAAIAAVVIVAVGSAAFWRAQRRPVQVATEATRRPRQRGRSASSAGGVSSPQAFCTQCGHQLGPDDRYCPRCGTEVRGR